MGSTNGCSAEQPEELMTHGVLFASSGGGRGIYSQVDGDLPMASSTCRPCAGPALEPCGGTRREPPHRSTAERTNVPARAVAHRSDAAEALDILHLNIQGYASHAAELTAYIRLRRTPPAIVCLNETFLDKSTSTVTLCGYELVARRDRRGGRKGGGVAIFARVDISNSVTLLLGSADAERLWLILHTDQGPYLLCTWYRPPEPGEVQTISTLEAEWLEHCGAALGTIILGDINVHHLRWLRYSSRNSAEGDEMRTFCLQHGFRQLVKEPTRGPNLLDLLITDIDDVKCTVLPAIADHKGILASLKLRVPRTEIVQRQVWSFGKADWDGLRCKLKNTSWDCISTLPPDDGAEFLTRCILEAAREFIPQHVLRERKTTHPWINERVLELVKAKHEAGGTDAEAAARDACSKGFLEEFGKYVNAERSNLSQMRRACKGWWSKTRQLLQHKGTVTSIPALKDGAKGWTLDAVGKADLFAKTF